MYEFSTQKLIALVNMSVYALNKSYTLYILFCRFGGTVQASNGKITSDVVSYKITFEFDYL